MTTPDHGPVTRYRLFGAVEVSGPHGVVDTGAPKQRALLARLLLDPGRVVSVDALADAVWDDPPPSAQASLQVFVSNLRKCLRDASSATSPIVRRGHGYLLDADLDDTDVGRFTAGCVRVQAAVDEGRWSAAAEHADATLALRRGPLLHEFADREWVRVAAAPLDEQYAACAANRVRALLGSDQVNAAVTAGRELSLAQPLSETAAWLHGVALYRAGRAADALELLRNYAQSLDDELALDTGPAIRDLQAGILRNDPGLQRWPGVAPRQQAVPAVVQPEPVPSHDQPADAGDDFVGRRPEVAAAAGVLAGARFATDARWLVLTGDAGIGKSRLAEQIVGGWSERVVRTGCPDDDGIPQWWPVRRLLDGIGADTDAVLATPTDTDADAARFAVYDAVTRALAAALAGGPLLLLVEDVHWADLATLRLLTHLAGLAGLAGTAAGAADQLDGLAVVITTRPADANRGLGRLLSTIARRPGSRLVPVPPLSSGEVADLAALVGGARLDTDEAVALAMRTGGNPFFVCEYARLPAAERDDDGVPAAVGTVLERRLANLDAGVLQLLRTAAVIGDTLDIDLLRRTARVDQDELADLLDEAADERIIEASGGAYVFGHALLRAKLLHDLPGLRRQRLHLRVADAVPGDDVPSLSRRARHLVAAGPLADPAATFAACRAAADAYEARLEPEVAATWWAHALAAFDLLGETTAGGLDRDDLVVAQVTSLARSGRGQTVLDVIDAALLDAIRRSRYDSVSRLAATLLRTSGSWPWAAYGSDPAPLLARLTDLETLVRAHPAAHVRVLAALAVGSCYDPDERVPDELSRRAVTLAETCDDPVVLADALLGRALAFSGVAVRADETLQLLDRLRVVQGDPAGAERNHDDVIAHGLAYLANVSLGRLDVAAGHVRAGVARSDLLRLSTSRVQFRWAEASLALAAGDDLDRVEALLHRAAELHRQTELYESGTFEIALFGLRWEQGRLAGSGDADANPRVMPWAAAVCAAAEHSPDAADLIAADLAAVTATPPLWTTHYRLTMLAHAAADAGAAHLAPALLEQLVPLTTRVANVGQVSIAGPVALAVARLHLIIGDGAAAAEALTVAEDLSRAAGARGWLRRCEQLADARVSAPLSP